MDTERRGEPGRALGGLHGLGGDGPERSGTRGAATARAVVDGDTIEALARAAEPGVAAAVWRRPREPLLAEWLDGLPDEALPSGRIVVAPGEVAAAVDALRAEAGLPDGPGPRALAQDVGALARSLAALLGAPSVRLRLDAIAGDACRRFHLDAVEARLLCTYRGPGTEYGLAGPREEPDPVRRLPTGSPAIFRGRLWRGTPSDLLHRSPPMAAAERARLLLVVDGPDPEA